MAIDYSKFGATESKVSAPAGVDYSQFGASVNQGATDQLKAPQPTQKIPSIDDVKQESGVGPGTAAIAGFASTGADIGQAVGNAGTWFAGLTHLISPETKAEMDSYLQKGSDAIRVTPDSQGDVFQKSAAAYPGTYAITRAVPEVLTATKAALPELPILKGYGLATKALNLGIQSLANATVAAGSSGDDQATQDMSAGITALMTPAIRGAVGMVNWIGQVPIVKAGLKTMLTVANKRIGLDPNTTITDKFAQSMSNLYDKTKLIINHAFAPITALPGTINPKPVQATINKMLTDSGSKYVVVKGDNAGTWSHNNSSIPELAPKLIGLQQQANAVKTMEDAIFLKQDMHSMQELFKTGNVPKPIADAYQALKVQVDTAIADKATKAGLEGEWAFANKLHKDTMVPLQTNKSGEISNAVHNKAADPSKANLTNYNKQTGNIANKVGLKDTPMAPDEAKKLLSVMDADGAQIVENKIINDIFGELESNALNFSVTKAHYQLNEAIFTYRHVLPPRSMKVLKGIQMTLDKAGVLPIKGNTGNLGLVATIPGSKGILGHIQQALESPTGVKFFRAVAEGKPWTKQVIQAMILGPAKGLQITGNVGDSEEPAPDVQAPPQQEAPQ